MEDGIDTSERSLHIAPVAHVSLASLDFGAQVGRELAAVTVDLLTQIVECPDAVTACQ